MTELPWRIVRGFVVSGSFETERERLMAEAVNESAGAAQDELARRCYNEGVEVGRALYGPRNWLARFFCNL